jgi:hypothetical protein
MKESSGSRFRSIRIGGAVNLKFIIGTKLWPPANRRPSVPNFAFKRSNSALVSGAKYENFEGFKPFSPLTVSLHLWFAPRKSSSFVDCPLRAKFKTKYHSVVNT